jgi:hypothetical protein
MARRLGHSNRRSTVRAVLLPARVEQFLPRVVVLASESVVTLHNVGKRWVVKAPCPHCGQWLSSAPLAMRPPRLDRAVWSCSACSGRFCVAVRHRAPR